MGPRTPPQSLRLSIDLLQRTERVSTAQVRVLSSSWESPPTRVTYPQTCRSVLLFLSEYIKTLFLKEYEYDRTYIIRINQKTAKTCPRKSSLREFTHGQRD